MRFAKTDSKLYNTRSPRSDGVRSSSLDMLQVLTRIFEKYIGWYISDYNLSQNDYSRLIPDNEFIGKITKIGDTAAARTSFFGMSPHKSPCGAKI